MLVRFLGVGEAWDTRHYNTSMLLDDGKTSLLVDCGISSQIPMIRFLEEEKNDLNYLDCIYFSHFHYDHAEGILPVLCVMAKFDAAPYLEPRKRPITIILPKGDGKRLVTSIKMHHTTVMEKFGYELKFVEVSPGDEIRFKSLKMRFSESRHSRKTLAVRIESGGKSFAYGGDGAPTKGSLKLYDGVDLLVHDAYSLKKSKALSHGTIPKLLDLAKKINMGKLALVHINRHERKDKMDKILKAISERGLKERVFIPEDGDEIRL